MTFENFVDYGGGKTGWYNRTALEINYQGRK